ncbi:hypothetical protein [Streptomyces justiciae]|uniref:Uncharacterized protein n=1 Tax=Streptomyces justiciae TaxID=2780140 RepID=A0ABU3LNI1_9ACTN|nr:hypothetical protein [Streptomyces justiciae]MDT7840794.1 hypothetical protein [Streptomyces justiciae]
MLYDVTLPGQKTPTHRCPNTDCQVTFQGYYTQKDVAKWDAIFEQQGDKKAVVKAHLAASGAGDVGHKPPCPLRCLPPAVVALCRDKVLIDRLNQVRAVLDDC